MKEKIQSYFEAQHNSTYLNHISELNTNQYFEGLSDMINDLSALVEDTQEQVDMLTPGSDPLSQVISKEIEEMKTYIIQEMLKAHLNDFLIVQYFTETCGLGGSPLDNESFKLNEALSHYKLS